MFYDVGIWLVMERIACILIFGKEELLRLGRSFF